MSRNDDPFEVQVAECAKQIQGWMPHLNARFKATVVVVALAVHLSEMLRMLIQSGAYSRKNVKAIVRGIEQTGKCDSLPGNPLHAFRLYS